MLSLNVSGWRTTLLAFCCSLAAVSACGDDGPAAGHCPDFASDNSCNPANADQRPHYITPAVVHTGHNGRDLYQAVLVANFGDLQLSSSNEDIVCAGRYGCVAPNTSGIVGVLTTFAPGEATVTARSGSVTETIAVKVTEYTTTQYDLGDQRYNNPANANATDRVACASCHTGQGGAPHSPLALAGTSDTRLLAAVEQSEYPDQCVTPDNAPCNCVPSAGDCSACPEQDCQFSEGYTLSLEAFGGGPGDHLYNLTTDERMGIMAYMRAIAPEGVD